MGLTPRGDGAQLVAPPDVHGRSSSSPLLLPAHSQCPSSSGSSSVPAASGGLGWDGGQGGCAAFCRPPSFWPAEGDVALHVIHQ